jgi:signal transduction histidine kinase
MEILLCISLITSVIFITLYVSIRKELSDVTNQLDRINKTTTNSRLVASCGDKKIRGLALEVNKTLEEKQKTEVKYKRMDAELRQAIANISHDLRTPLTSIIGYMQLMDDSGLSMEERKQYIDIVDKRAKDLQVLITSFYDLSRLEANEYTFELKSINITNMILDIIASFYNDFSNRGIEPFVDIDEKAVMIIADENAATRVFSNLIQNMIKYGEKSVEISLKLHKNSVETIFSNYAPGLTEEDVSHLFERSFTADRNRTGNSTGLGLAIVKQLVEQMGHKVSAGFADGKLSITVEWIRR